MSEFLRDALLELLFRLMASHVDRGLSYDEALMLAVVEIRRQIRGTRYDLEALMIAEVMHRIADARHDTRLH